LGIYDRDYFREQQRSGLSSYLPRSAVGAIIAVNAAVWLVDAFTATTEHTGLVSGAKTINWVSNLFAVHVSTLTHPWYWWQFLTAGFTHAPLGSKVGIWHIVGNMAVLYFLGRPVEDKYGPKEFLRFYLVALVFANVAWCVIGKLTGTPDNSLWGASGAVAAVVVLFAINFPDVTILLFFVIPMPAWLFGVLIVGYDIYGAISRNSGSNVAYTAHVAGAAFGLLYYQLGWNFSRLGMGGLRWPRSPFRSKPRLRVLRPDDEPPANDLSADVDRILEKIYREGEASLTPKERSTLEAASRKYQERRGSGK
jgi:membrane associated rhomboid family serine protease